MKSERWWLSWSAGQARLYVERESVGLRANRSAFNENRRVDYTTIGVFYSEEEARAMADRLDTIEKRGYDAKVRTEEAKRKAGEAKWKS